jgi:hypothetical protein
MRLPVATVAAMIGWIVFCCTLASMCSTTCPPRWIKPRIGGLSFSSVPRPGAAPCAGLIRSRRRAAPFPTPMVIGEVPMQRPWQVRRRTRPCRTGCGRSRRRPGSSATHGASRNTACPGAEGHGKRSPSRSARILLCFQRCTIRPFSLYTGLLSRSAAALLSWILVAQLFSRVGEAI